MCHTERDDAQGLGGWSTTVKPRRIDIARHTGCTHTYALSANCKLKAFKIESAEEYGGFMYRRQTDRQIGSCPPGAWCSQSTESLFMRTLRDARDHIGEKSGRECKEREKARNWTSRLFFCYTFILLSCFLSSRLSRVNTNAVPYGVTSGYSHSKPSADAGVSFVRQESLSALAHSNARSGNRSTSHDVTVESNPSRGRDRKIQY